MPSKILHQEKGKITGQEISPMTMEEFKALIEQAEKYSENNSLYNAGEILKDIDTWE